VRPPRRPSPRLERFPQGFFVACLGEQIVATITATPTAFDERKLHRYRDWASVTNDGYLIARQPPA
jgi:hypothetical protein